MKRNVLPIVVLLFPILVVLADISVGVRSLVDWAAYPVVRVDEAFVSLRNTSGQPYRWLMFQKNGARKLAELEERYARIIARQSQVLEEETLLAAFPEDAPDAFLRYVSVRIVFTELPILYVGRADGVQEGAAVLDNGVFVGWVSYASRNLSTITLVSDMQYPLRVIGQKSGIEGILRKVDRGYVIEELSWDASVDTGEVFLTYGTSDGIPPMIPVAEVTKNESKASDPTQRVEAELLFTPKHGDAVLVMKNM